MKIFLASANSEEIEQAYQLPIAGVLTNSTILLKEKTRIEKLINKIDQIGNKEFGLQVASTNLSDMRDEVILFKSLLKNRQLHLKIPFCFDAFKLIKEFKNSGLILNLTGISTFLQAIMAIEADIDYLSIYVGRINSAGGDGINLVKEIKQYTGLNQVKTGIIAASIRDRENLESVAKAGADAVAIPFTLLMDCLQSKVTTESIEGFSIDWDLVKGIE